MDATTLTSPDGTLAVTLIDGPYLTVASLRCAAREFLADPQMLPNPYRVHGERAGITLLHPWANRLGSDTFSVGERRVTIPVHDPLAARDPSGLPIHGLANPQGWSWESVGPLAARATASWPELKEFPFAHDLEVTVELHPPRELAVTTTLSARTTPVPVAFGWHPYFRAERAHQCTLSLPRRRSLALDATGLPTGAASDQEPATISLDGISLDDGFAGVVDGSSFRLHAPPHVVEVRHEGGFDYAQVFAPLDAEVVSFEPMTAPTDALRTGRGLRFATPGEPYTARFTVAFGDLPG